MAQFFIEGGFGMYPVLIIGLVLLYSSVRYMLDGEPVRTRLIVVLSLALLTTVTFAFVTNMTAVMHALTRFPADAFAKLFAQGLKESWRPVLLGFGLLALSLDLIAIGVYRVSRRELRAAKG